MISLRARSEERRVETGSGRPATSGAEPLDAPRGRQAASTPEVARRRLERGRPRAAYLRARRRTTAPSLPYFSHICAQAWSGRARNSVCSASMSCCRPTERFFVKKSAWFR
jgi:hypothetical protein